MAQHCSTLRDAGVEIRCGPSGIRGRGKVRPLVDSPDKAKDALKTAKIRFSEEEAMSIELENRAGTLGGIADNVIIIIKNISI